MAAGDAMDQGVRFDGFRFDAQTGRLWAGEREIRLTPRAAAVLSVLVTHAGQPVSKEDLFATVWQGVAVGDDALTTCIQELRRALEDDARQPRFIETRHRRGYRFVAQVAPATDSPAAMPEPDTHLSAVAVLPFADMSPGRDQGYLCEGLAEELINALAQIDGLRVASRTASFRLGKTGTDLREVGRQLGVGTLLEGSVRTAANRLRLTVQLTEVDTGYTRWSQRFDRTLDDLFAIQDEIARSVTASLRGGALSRREQQALARPQTDATAYEYYLRGRQHLPRMSRPDLEESGDWCERAIAVDPGYAPAWAGLAMARATLYEWFGGRADDLAAAERASSRALDLAPDLADSHVARGLVLSLSGRYGGAATAFERAAALNPHLFEAYYYHARSSFAAGAIEASANLFGRAADVRKEDFQSPMLLAQSLRMLGRRDEALEAAREGIRRAELALTLNPVDGRALSLGSGALFLDGQVARAMAWCRRALELYPDDVSTLVNAACLHAKAGQKEEALALLERVFARGWGKRDWVEHDPDYDILRDDPRFAKLLAGLS
ncbi:MAG: winged helix-turn-helix domain-containing tetratricopeptide repeat protein [Betaproteobacteria bacterium]